MGKVILQHDNARPHVAKLTKEKLKTLGWEVLPHPPYSPDLASSDFHLFKKLAADLANEHFGDDDEMKKFLDASFKRQPRNFWEKGIHALPNKWQQVIVSNGEYIESIYALVFKKLLVKNAKRLMHQPNRRPVSSRRPASNRKPF